MRFNYWKDMAQESAESGGSSQDSTNPSGNDGTGGSTTGGGTKTGYPVMGDDPADFEEGSQDN